MYFSQLLSKMSPAPSPRSETATDRSDGCMLKIASFTEGSATSCLARASFTDRARYSTA